MIKTITPEEAAELRSLYEQLSPAIAHVMETLRTDPPLHNWTEEAQTKFREADARVSEITRRIREISG